MKLARVMGVKSILKGLSAAAIASGVTLGCTGLLGSFDVSNVEPSGPLPDGGNPDGPSTVDGSSDGPGTDTAPPLACKAGEVKCVVENVCAVLATNVDNCGKCGHSCGGGTCKAGVCAPFKLYDGAVAVGPIDVGDVDYFFATSDGNTDN